MPTQHALPKLDRLEQSCELALSNNIDLAPKYQLRLRNIEQELTASGLLNQTDIRERVKTLKTMLEIAIKRTKVKQ